MVSDDQLPGRAGDGQRLVVEGEDIADAIAYAVAAPPRVNVAELVVVPVEQG